MIFGIAASWQRRGRVFEPFTFVYLVLAVPVWDAGRFCMLLYAIAWLPRLYVHAKTESVSEGAATVDG
mgnify:CR=1 FL=1